ncbi:MAG: VanZ family protein [Deltaproteobacteria bacterium]|nr:MAG: VanZ family protein [Deltaproteobacteria bacterium]
MNILPLRSGSLLRWIPALSWCAVIFWASGRSDPGIVPPIPFADKVLHFGAYALLGLLFAFAQAGSWPRIATPWIAILLTALYGVGDEFHQAFVPGRDFDPFDMLADALGGSAGAWLAFRFGLPGWMEAASAAIRHAVKRRLKGSPTSADL